MKSHSEIAGLPDTETLERVAENRMPIEALDEILSYGVSWREIHNIVITPRTLSRRKSEGFLHKEEGDKSVTLAQILKKAFAVFDDREKALRWLRSEKTFLSGKTPMEVLSLTTGARLVEDRLNAIEHGMF